MNSKQADSDDQQKKAIPEDWLPTSSVGGKTKSTKLPNENVEAEFQKMLESGVIDGTSPNCNVTAGTIESEDNTNIAASIQTESIADTPTTAKRMSNKQRKESLEEYRDVFLRVPKLDDRKPVFISREVRDSLDEIARKLGGRRMSVSGFIENLARHHLEIYRDDVEMWKKF